MVAMKRVFPYFLSNLSYIKVMWVSISLSLIYKFYVDNWDNPNFFLLFNIIANFPSIVYKNPILSLLLTLLMKKDFNNC